MRVLITGAGGLVGSELVTAFAGDHRQVVGLAREDLDVGDRQAVLAAVSQIGPDLVVHAAAFTKVDDCESDIDTAFRVNALGTRHVAEACRRVGAHLTTYSTDYVFDGTKATPYLEWDPTGPVSVYGASKLAGEREAGPEALVLRTSWVFGRHRPNIVTTILRLAEGDGRLRFVHDQVGHPTCAADLAEATVRLATAREVGVHHVTNQGATSWHGFAQAVLEAAGHDPERVDPVATHELQPPRPAPRPANSVLDNAALRLKGLDLLPDYRGSLQRTVKELLT